MKLSPPEPEGVTLYRGRGRRPAGRFIKDMNMNIDTKYKIFMWSAIGVIIIWMITLVITIDTLMTKYGM